MFQMHCSAVNWGKCPLEWLSSILFCLPSAALYVSIFATLWRHMRYLLLLILVISTFAFSQSQPQAAQSTPGTALGPQKFKLPATPKTVAWGYYDATATPVLRIHSGDTVEFDTLITNSPTGLERAGVPADQVQQSLRDIYKEVTNKGPGGHILNGPVYVEEAEPGDTLEVRIQKIDLAIPYAYNAYEIGRAHV